MIVYCAHHFHTKYCTGVTTESLESRELNLNRSLIITKHNNEYLNMTSICAIFVVSFGWTQRF